MGIGPILAIWIVCAILGYGIGGGKGKAAEGLVLGLLLGAIGVLIIAVMKPTVEVQAKRDVELEAAREAERERLREEGRAQARAEQQPAIRTEIGRPPGVE
jgi:hypothetical protein